MVAHFWHTDTFRLRSYPAREYRMMAEARNRMIQAENEALERAKHGGLPVEKTPGPKSKDW